MAADAGAGLQNVDAGMAVGEADHLPHVDAHRVGNEAQFVGEGDIDVAEGVFGELRHLGRAGIGGDARAADESAVEGQRLAGAAWRDAADHPVVVDQLDEDAAGQHAFRAIGDGDVCGFAGATGYAQIGA